MVTQVITNVHPTNGGCNILRSVSLILLCKCSWKIENSVMNNIWRLLLPISNLLLISISLSCHFLFPKGNNEIRVEWNWVNLLAYLFAFGMTLQ